MSTKRFLLLFGCVYLVLALTWIGLFGPPGLSKDYREQYNQDHERYLEIVKSEGYKRYAQRPALIEQEYERNPHLTPSLEHLRAGAVFVEEYESRPEFIAQERRIAIYQYFFEFLNVLAIVVLAVRFLRKPLLAFLDRQVAAIRGRIEKAASARREAEERKAAAEAKLEGLEAEKERVREQADELIELEAARIREATEHAIAQIVQETEERKHMELHHAAMQLKQELVTQAVDQLAERLKAEVGHSQQTALIEEFVRSLEGRRMSDPAESANG